MEITIKMKRADNKLIANKLVGVDLLSENTYFSYFGREEVCFSFSSRTNI